MPSKIRRRHWLRKSLDSRRTREIFMGPCIWPSLGEWPRLLILGALPTPWVPRSFAFFAKGGSRKCWRHAGLITCPQQNQIAHAASPPTPSQKKREGMGRPQFRYGKEKQIQWLELSLGKSYGYHCDSATAAINLTQTDFRSADYSALDRVEGPRCTAHHTWLLPRPPR